MTLAELRAHIDATDRELLALLAERAQLVTAAFALKQSQGLPQLDPEREAEVVRRLQEAGAALGLDGEAVAQVWRAILRLERQPPV